MGVIAEGAKDEPIFEELLPKIEPAVTKVVVRPSRGKPRFLGALQKLLWSLQYVEPGGPPDKAIVVRDANSDDPAEVEAAMRRCLEGRRYPWFRRGVEFHATRRETETWLLADVEAISRVAIANGGQGIGAIPGPLEEIADAKERFVRLLKSAGLPYAPEVVRQIVREVDIGVIRDRCPGFRSFEEKVRR